MNVGIDLGTTYSAVAYFDKAKGVPVILSNSEGEKTTPSVTHIEKGKVSIGNEAKSLMSSGDCNSVAFYKSMIGEKDVTYYVDDKDYSAEDLSALFLAELKKDIEKANGIKIDGAVITCPAYFDETRRTATLNAGKRAGFNVLKIINEPTSAIIAYGLTGGAKKNVLVYDLGGGTFDVTIAEVNGSKIKVLTTNGDHSLGGKNWDSVIADYLAEQFMAEYNVDISNNPEDATELQVSCEDVKKKLTSMKEVTAVVRSEGFVGKYKITREEFDQKTEFLLNQTEMLIDKCFMDLQNNGYSNFGWGNIDEVVLVGGSTRMPQVKDMVVNRFGKPPVTGNINVDTIVASGAAIQAELCVSQTLMLGVAPSKSAGTLGGAPVANNRLEIRSSDIEDITSHSLGMLAFDKSGDEIINSIILKKDSKIGVAEDKNYEFKGTELHAYVLQGEETDPYECNLLYHYIISGMTKGQKNKICVSYLYNQNGIVEVTAKTADGKALKVDKMAIDEDISTIIERLKMEQKKPAGKIEVLMLIDVSGSMDGTGITEAKRAMETFVSSSDTDCIAVGIEKFGNRHKTHLRFSNNKSTILSSIRSLSVDGDVGYGTEGKSLFADLKGAFSKDADAKIIITLTDGEWCSTDTAIKESKTLKDMDVKIFAVGVAEANYDFLRKIASEGCARKVDASELSQAFGDIAGSIAKEF